MVGSLRPVTGLGVKIAQSEAERGVATLLRLAGYDPESDGLRDTPRRFVEAIMEMAGDPFGDPGVHLERSFQVEHADELIVVRGIPFDSLCEHHLFPFSGEVHVGYLPQSRVVGLSKIARMARGFARRLQTQERMTHEIASAVMENGCANAVGVVVEADHSCMRCRGVRSKGTMVTSALYGSIRENQAMRDEFFRLVRGARA